MFAFLLLHSTLFHISYVHSIMLSRSSATRAAQVRPFPTCCNRGPIAQGHAMLTRCSPHQPVLRGARCSPRCAVLSQPSRSVSDHFSKADIFYLTQLCSNGNCAVRSVQTDQVRWKVHDNSHPRYEIEPKGYACYCWNAGLELLRRWNWCRSRQLC